MRKPRYVRGEKKAQRGRFKEAMRRIAADNDRCALRGIPLARFTVQECLAALKPLELTKTQERRIMDGITKPLTNE